MTNPPQALVGLAIIAKNEEEALPRLLASIDGAYDRVVLVDTGSDDATVDVFKAWALDQQSANDDFSYDFAYFTWVDDFSEARNFADEVLMRIPVQWRSWADCDDVIIGAENIRSLLHNTPAEVAALFCHYDYFRDPATNRCLNSLPRERFVRTSAGMKWEGRVHEAQPVVGGSAQFVPEGVVYWRHMVTLDGLDSNERNLRILEKWAVDEPLNTRVIAYLGTELASAGRIDEAITQFEGYLKLDSDWEEEVAQVRRKLAKLYMSTEQFVLARQQGVFSIARLPSWTDGYMTLAEASLALKKPKDAIHWAKIALEMGAPTDTVLIINPVEYQYMPNKVMAGALAELGRFDEAIQVANGVLSLVRDDSVIAMVQHWTKIRQQENTCNVFIQMTQQLVAHDEQAKALMLLEQCVPHFIADHPRIVECRSELRARTSWVNAPVDYADHYENGGSKPEDFIADEQIDDLCQALPRTQFLLDNVSEQITSKINEEIHLA